MCMPVCVCSGGAAVWEQSMLLPLIMELLCLMGHLMAQWQSATLWLVDSDTVLHSLARPKHTQAGAQLQGSHTAASW